MAPAFRPFQRQVDMQNGCGAILPAIRCIFSKLWKNHSMTFSTRSLSASGLQSAAVTGKGQRLRCSSGCMLLAPFRIEWIHGTGTELLQLHGRQYQIGKPSPSSIYISGKDWNRLFWSFLKFCAESGISLDREGPLGSLIGLEISERIKYIVLSWFVKKDDKTCCRVVFCLP